MALLQEIRVPLLSVNDTNLTVVEINYANGQRVKKGDRILVFETSKTTYEVESEFDGYIQYLCQIDHDYMVNETVVRLFSDEREAQMVTSKMEEKKLEPTSLFAKKESKNILWEGETLFSSAALQMMEAKGLNKQLFKGKDFVGMEDVEGYLGIRQSKGKPSKTELSSQGSRKLLPTDTEKVIIENLSSNKKREIEYLSEVQQTGLTSTINIYIVTDGIFTFLNQSLKFLKDSLLPLIVYETGRLLRKYPLLNAYYTGNEIAVYKQVNIGFAIDIDKGLKVMKIKNTAELKIGEIESEIMRLSNNYLDDRLQIQDMTDITFTITDLSAEGILSFRPLVNMMNSAILGISSIDEELQRCILSITFDHRVTEGKMASQFLKDLKERLESYRSKIPTPPQIVCYKCFKKLSEDLGEVGFMKCITPSGYEDYICQSCLKGF